MKIIIYSCSIIVFIILVLLIYVLVIDYKNKGYFKPKIYELFEYNFYSACQCPFKYDKTPYKKCSKDVFNGFRTTQLNWKSNPKGKNLICFYFWLSSNYENLNDELYYGNNYWLTIYDKKLKSTVGTARWSNCYKNNKSAVAGKANVPFSKSVITATSGILKNLQGANILTDFRNDVRKIHIYTKGYKNKDYEEYRKKNLLEQKI